MVMVRVHPRQFIYIYNILKTTTMVMDDAKNKLFERHLKRTRERIQKEQNLYYENLKSELISKPLIGQSLEEKEKSKRKLLDYIHKYVFLQRLEPIDTSSLKVLDILRANSKAKIFFKQMLLFRDLFGSILKIKSVLIFLSAIFFFFLEYWIHYYSSFLLKDVNVTLQMIIDKIPPFF